VVVGAAFYPFFCQQQILGIKDKLYQKLYKANYPNPHNES